MGSETLVNDPPVAVEQTISADENVPIKITLSGSDPEKDPINFRIVTQPLNGTMTGTPPELTYEPKYGFVGEDSFTFVANDGKADSALATTKITVKQMANPYDVNRDGIINILDLAIISVYFSKDKFPLDRNPDVNRDGNVDKQDFDIVLKNFGKKL